ncbi:MFS transporter [Streptomyces tsukubensis]|uniref:MFS transporter n=1 Tax=Streptomyces tsukubensis TaxID=83656 RepID=A0A1V4A0X0_9ACTN|nr:MFS transporter [Streptomyces tsukubensis]OON71950.1 MFS transporter [Streptomyces tsukubensis]
MLGVLLVAVFMAQFDFFVANVAAPSLSANLHAGRAALELIVGGYAFAYASGMITGGRLGDLFGHRRMFVAGMLGFAVASVLCGVAADPAQLVVFRLLQGLAGAAMVPQVLATVTAVFPATARPAAIAWYSAAAGIGSIAGQVLGGMLLQADVFGLGWRVIFLVNGPIGVVAAFVALRVLPGRAADAPTSAPGSATDPLGALGVAGSLALLVVPLTLGRDAHWPLWTWACVVAAVPVGFATVRRQQRLAARGGTPTLELSLFGSPPFRTGLLAGAAFYLYFGSFMFTLTLLLQAGLGHSPVEAGLIFAPMGVLFGVSSMVGKRLIARHGLKVVLAGSALIAAGLALLATALGVSSGQVALPVVVVALSIVGTGNGVVLPALNGATLALVRPHQAGSASGVLSTTQQFASAMGVAVIGTFFYTVLGSRHGADGYAGAMGWTALVAIGLTIATGAMVWRLARLSRRAAR